MNFGNENLSGIVQHNECETILRISQANGQMGRNGMRSTWVD